MDSSTNPAAAVAASRFSASRSGSIRPQDGPGIRQLQQPVAVGPRAGPVCPARRPGPVISRMARALLLDIDGVLTVSWQPLTGAADTLAWLDANQIAFRLVTNTSSRSRDQIAGSLAAAPVRGCQ